MELLLHYVWRHKIFPLLPLLTTEGYPVEVIDPGLPNRNAGPDFFNAKLKIGGVLWVGNIEVHEHSSDWQLHGHHHDTAYDSVILHVVGEVNAAVCRTTGEPIPQLQLSCPDEIRQRYDELALWENAPACHNILPKLPKLMVHGWLSALQSERLDQRTALIKQRLQRFDYQWEDVFFITLARNFGFGLNGDVFEEWAGHLPFRFIDKHRDNLFQVEAFFFGQAGLLEDDGTDEYFLKLQKEFRYLQHKFSLDTPLPVHRWRFLRSRPGNFPHVRIAQLAALYHTRSGLFSQVMEAETLDVVKALFVATSSDYWRAHFHFAKQSSSRQKRVGARALQLIVINTVVPFLYAYGQHKADERLCERAVRFLETLPAEDNHIIRSWNQVGISVDTAADSQALIQLQKMYCDKRECLRCRFGYEFLRAKQANPTASANAQPMGIDHQMPHTPMDGKDDKK